MWEEKCGHCNKQIINKTEVEYSHEYTTFYCNYNCAISDFFERAICVPFDFEDKKLLKENNLKIENGKLYSL